MNCPKCKKPTKENTDGNMKYCQGHSPFDEPVKQRLGKPWPPEIRREPGDVTRNECWNCNNYFSVARKYWLKKEEGQKQYLKCNHCGKVNHL